MSNIDDERARRACAASVNSSRRLAETARMAAVVIDSSDGIPLRDLDEEDSLVMHVEQMLAAR